MPILGIDPGLHTTGYGLVEFQAGQIRFLEAGVIRSGNDELDIAERIKVLHDGISEVLDEFKPSVVAIEQLYAHYEHPRTAILMGHARGVFLLAAAQRKIDVVSYAATKVKKLITGSGRASKEQIQMAITRELNLEKIPEPHDAADALAIAVAHGYSGGAAHGNANARYTGVNRKMLFEEGDE
jgi:crossover junction endodeoxyribonuclease RuvC